MLKPSLQLRVGQQLTMTPQLQQAIRLLQLPSLDLQAHVRETLETNVMLEAEDELALETPLEAVAEGAREEPPPEEKYAELDGNAAAASDQREEPEVEIADEAWGEQTSGPSDSAWSGEDRSGDFSDAHAQTLQEQLIEQLELAKLSPIDLAIARVIADAITDDGYLHDDLEEVRQSLKPEIEASYEDVERVLAAVQSLEPAGVGARSLGECIALQLRQLHPDTPARDIAIRVALEHLDLVANQQLVLLRRQLRCSEGDLEMALALVRSCHPRPGAAVNPAQAEYVIPDVFVRRTEHGWTVEINQATVPRVRVNQSYANAISRAPDHAMLRTQLQEARWLMRSLEIRNETLIKVARCIVQRQTSFFELGEEAMEPLILKDVAEAVEMHESTISRVTTAKYMHTPRGVFEFRYFFSSHVEAADGTEMSSTAIRAKIKKLISQENPENPWSDSKLAEILSREGIPVARRTVAKYREGMQISPSNERKRAQVRAS
jgi:RNA polymerase sigma-54 factor